MRAPSSIISSENFSLSTQGLLALGVAVFVLFAFFIWRRRRRASKPFFPRAPSTTPSETTPRNWEAGLQSSSSSLSSVWKRLGMARKADENLLDELEETLITSDFGVDATQGILAAVRETSDPAHLKNAVVDVCLRTLSSVQPAESLWERIEKKSHRPFVILLVGVNGVGKTTTIGKLASLAKTRGLRVCLAAGDTFRAAASEQLKAWAERTGADVISRGEGGDPASVLFDAFNHAQASGHDLLLCDTAGRLHSKQGLMEELAKCHRVLKKVDPTAPHETFLVLDATTGQNAVRQAQEFHKALTLSGIILTKLDGTAKGGIVVAIAHHLRIPVVCVGLGEGAQDLVAFDPKAFTQALLPLDSAPLNP